MPVLRRYRLAAQITVLLGGLRRCLCRLLGLLLGEPAERGESGESFPVALLDHVPLSPPRSVERSLPCFAARGPVSPRRLPRSRAAVSAPGVAANRRGTSRPGGRRSGARIPGS